MRTRLGQSMRVPSTSPISRRSTASFLSWNVVVRNLVMKGGCQYEHFHFARLSILDSGCFSVDQMHRGNEQMKNRTALGGYDVQSGSHIAPGARCELNVIQLAGATPS